MGFFFLDLDAVQVLFASEKAKYQHVGVITVSVLAQLCHHCISKLQA